MSAYQISRRIVFFGMLPAACGLAAPPDRKGSATGEAASGRAEPDAPVIVGEVFDVTRFGASPEASAAVNTAAFAAASAALNRAGGGTLVVPPGVYRVGVQRLSGAAGRGGAHRPDDVIRIEGCRDPVAILGRGATLRAVDGMRFGTFDPATGRRHDPPMPFTDYNYSSTAPIMILVRKCSGAVRIEGFTLDGNAEGYVLGGDFGDTGRQLAGDGILCEANTGGVVICDVRTHDHGRDGIMFVHHGLTSGSPRYPVTLTDVVCDRNGRQGLSWVGGTELTATRCRFSRTGRGRVMSAPAAGVDIEAEDSVCRNGRFVQCRFVDNGGCGLVAEAGDNADMVFERCEFIGTTNWSAWPRMPDFVFRDCLFVGSIVNCFADPSGRRATKFIDCRFHGDTALSPTGKVYGEFLMDLGGGAAGVLMRRCDFRAVSPAIALGWTNPELTFEDCRFHQAGPSPSHPRGVFTGVNRIDSAGPVGLDGSRFLGRVILNGRTLG